MKKLLLIFIFIISNLLYYAQNQSNIDVTNYVISLDFTDMSNEQISGFADLTINLSNSTNFSTINLDLLKLQVDSVFLYNNVLAPLKITEVSYNDTIITITIPEEFQLEPFLNVKIYYHGHPIRGIGQFGGFYFSDNYAFNMGVSLYDIPHNFGKVWFPCNDNFIDRAKYHFFITTTPENIAVCNGNLIAETENENKKTYEWLLNEEIPTYLASVAVSNFNLWQSNYHNINDEDIPINIYAVSINNVNTSFQNINSALSIFEDKFGAYRWNRIGYVAVPFNAGAMEHATNIAIGNSMIVNGVTYEDVFYHELSHHWFGDLITCRTAEDMWLNEGTASYCETIFREFHYGKENGKNYRRAAHLKVVRDLKYTDGGFRPISPMPLDLTYSETVYEKGASVFHSLRGYLGDTIFFDAMKKFLSENEFSDVSSEDLRDFISDYSQIDMTDFFDDHVFTGGFVHYSIDSVVPQMSFPEIASLKVYIRQKLKGRTEFANSNRVELTFMNAIYEKQTRIIEFDGEYGDTVFNFDMFFPVAVFCDLEEKFSDATFDTYKFVKTTGAINLPSTNTTITATSVPANDSAFIRVTHNLVSPDSTKIEIPGVFTVNSRYWLVEGIFPIGFKAKSEFLFYTISSANLDNGYISNNMLDSMLLLYRPNSAANWTIENAIYTKSFRKFTVDSLKLGEYCFGFYNRNGYISINDEINSNKNNDKILVFPNPAQNYVDIKFPNKEKYIINFYNIEGKIIVNKKNNSDFVKIDIEKFKNGTYILEIKNIKNEVVLKEKIIKKL